MRQLPANLVAMVLFPLLLATGCGGGSGDGEGADAGPDGDGGAGGDGGGGGGGATFIIFSNGAVPCEWILGQEVCPPDHNQELFRVDFDPATGEARETRLTSNSDGVPPPMTGASPDDDRFLALSPDDEWVYFANALAGGSDIYRIRADGSSAEPEMLTAAADADYFLALSKDGGTIWYVSNKDGKFDLHRMDAAGGGAIAENLTQDALEEDLDEVHAMLPDESGLIIRVGSGFNDPDGTDVDGELYRFRFAERDLVRLTDNRVNDKFAALSRDGAQVFFTRYDDQNDDGDPDSGYNLWVVPADGSAAARQLTSYDSSSLELMALTPDGARAVYEYRGPGAMKEIFSIAMAGGDPVQISDSPGGESSYYRLMTQDGATVIYTSNDRPDGFGDTEIYTVPVAGGASTLVTGFDNTSYFLPVTHVAKSGLLLYDSPVDGDTDVYSVVMSGGEHVNLTNNEGWGDQVRGLSDDGDYLFFSNLSDDPIYDEEGMLTPENDQDIYLVKSDGTGGVHQLTDNRVYDSLDAVVMSGAGGTRSALRPVARAGQLRLWPPAPSVIRPIDDRSSAR